MIYLRLDIRVQEMSKGKITMNLVIDQNDLDLWFTDEAASFCRIHGVLPPGINEWCMSLMHK